MKTFRLTKDDRYNSLKQASNEIISELKDKIILLKDENRKLKKEIEDIKDIQEIVPYKINDKTF